MHNHIHMACEICPEQIEALTDTEVVSRWRSLYQGPVIIQKWVKGEKLLDAERTMVDECIAEYRRRLASIVNNNRKVIHPHQLKSDPLFFRVFH